MALLAALVLVQQAGAYVYTFQDADEIDDWAGNMYLATSVYSDNIILVEPDDIAKHTISYPTNYWAATYLGYSQPIGPQWLALNFYDASDSYFSWLKLGSAASVRVEPALRL